MDLSDPKPEQYAVNLLDAMERELVQLRQELDHSHRLAMIGTLTAGIAHEMNNVLTPALMYAKHLEKHAGDDVERQRDAARHVAKAIESASRILQAVLGFSTAAPGDTCADVDRQLQSALDCLGRDLARDQITLERRVRPGALVAITPISLQQVLLNLLLNARQAMRGRGGCITVAAIERPDGCTDVTFADDGPGIPAAIAETVFEPFVSWRVGAGGSRTIDVDAGAGTGLGLAVCRRAIEAAGGTIGVRSTRGGGASFLIRLRTAPATPSAKAG